MAFFFPQFLFNRSIFGANGSDEIDGTQFGELIFGLSGDDIIRGNGGEDRIFGGDGDDELIGGRGDDEIFGGHGDDLMIWNNGDGSDRMDGGEGDDRVQVNGADGDGDVFEIFADGDDVLFQRTNLGPFELEIVDVETLEINGQDGDDVIEARAGVGGLIDLVLDGGDGDDTITGAEGDDIIIGGSGNNVLSGGAGADIFVFRSFDEGVSVILDFEVGVDRLVFSDDLTFDSLAFGTVEGSAALMDAFTGEAVAIVEGVTAAELVQDEFLLFA
ncbi:MAG: calcium-binding protein [Pseudomonadota bacterium]